MARGLKVFGCCYQPYVHPPDAIAERLRKHGLLRIYAARTPVWLTEVDAREPDAGSD